MSLRSMPIATRAALSFALITALLVITGIFSLNRMGSLNEASSDISDNWLPSVMLAGNLKASISDLRTLESQHVLNTDEAAMERFIHQRAKALADGSVLRRVAAEPHRVVVLRGPVALQAVAEPEIEHIEGGGGCGEPGIGHGGYVWQRL